MSSETGATGLEIAIIGMAGRFPTASSVDELWQRLVEGVECIHFFSDEELRAAGVPAAVLADPSYVKAGGVVDDADGMDAEFFGYSPREAARIDPQQRLFLETAWSALEHAGYAPGTYANPIGVFGGTGVSHYFHDHVLPAHGGRIDHPTTIANDKDFLATRVSYKLNLEGPSIAIQTACSTSLVAVHLACQSLIAGECDMALAGGVTIRLPQESGYFHQDEGIASPDGHCRAFSASARGCLPGNGGAIVVLKRLSDAIADRDTIHAVIKGSAVNNDGARKIGYTAPRVEGQARVIRAALSVAGVDAATIGYLEAHGTGTILGDPIEIEAATKAFRGDTASVGYCAIGSIKTNIGHLDTAAGVTGLIKTALIVKHGIIPASLHFDRPNPHIPFENSPFYVNASRRVWPNDSATRRAGVSSFGIGGTNAHAIVEEPPRVAPSSPRSSELLVLSARSERALQAASDRLAEHLRANPDLQLPDVAYTLRHGRAAFRFRGSVACGSVDDAIERLTQRPSLPIAAVPDSAHSAVVFMFPGQGSQYPGMAADLYNAYPQFKREIDSAALLLAPELGFDLRSAILARADDEHVAARLRDTRVAQPAIFTIAYATARLLQSWGVNPTALIGHSIGEYVAACLAGVFSAGEALTLVSARGRLMSEVAPGGMLAVPLPAVEVERNLPPQLAVAAVNSDRVTVVAGPQDAIGDFEATLRARGVEPRALHTSHAFHSPMMDTVMPAFVACFRNVQLKTPQLPFVSNVTGTWIQPHEATDPHYWARHLRGTVRFADGLRTIVATRPAALVEVGPGQTLAGLAGRQLEAGTSTVVLSTTRRADAPPAAVPVLLDAVGKLWERGVAVDWKRMDEGSDARRVPLPTYAFERARHWIDATTPQRAEIVAATAEERRDLATWFSVPTWERMPRPLGPRSHVDSAWVVFVDRAGVADAVVATLRTSGTRVLTVHAGDAYRQIGDDEFEVAPEDPRAYEHLVDALRRAVSGALRIAHCWNVTAHAHVPAANAAHAAEEARNGFYSVLWLARALGATASIPDCHIAVLSSSVHDVSGREVLCAGRALVLGACRGIPLEYDAIRCTHIDLELNHEGRLSPDTVERVVDTIQSEPREFIAIRGEHRWQQRFVPLTLGPVQDPALLKPQGVYLITGGLGGVGLAIANYLARTYQARLVLIGRTGFPPDVAARPALESARLDANGALKCLAEMVPGLTTTVPVTPLSSYAGLETTLDRLSSAIVVRTLATLGVRPSDAVYTASGLAEQCHIVPELRRLFDRMLDMAVEDGALVRADDGIRVQSLAADLDGPIDAARRDHPQIVPVFDLLERCATHYAAALSGRIPAVSLLFGEEHRATFVRAVDTVRAHSYLPLCERLIESFVREAMAQPRQRPLRILEIGGGEGRLTEVLLPILDGGEAEYQFTDIGRSFVLNAERQAARHGRSYMRCRELDIARRPSEQGFAPGSCDVVLAFNVLHATSSVAESLAHAKELLAPGGVLVLQESVQPSRWVDLVWGLTGGWFAFTDVERRRESPLLSQAGWEDALRGAGFDHVAAYPSMADAAADTSVIVARVPLATTEASAADPIAADSSRVRESIVQSLEAKGAQVEIAAVDVADPEAFRTAVEHATARFGRIDGVIHAALVLNDGTIELKTRESIERVFAPKVAGTLAIDQVFAGCQLDFIALFSSLVSIFGGAGQVDYCAASNFQDAWAHRVTSSTARTVVSINWGAWRQIGKAFRSAVDRGASPETALPHGMSPDEGVEAFVRALHAAQSQVLVSPQALEHVAPRRAARTEVGTGDVTAPAQEDPGPAPGAPRSDAEQLIASIWQDVLGIERVSIDDNFFDLGGDSMISLQFIAKAKKAGLRFTNRQVFEHQTVAQLAALPQAASVPGSRT